VRTLQIKKLLLEGITTACLPLNIKESAHLNQIKNIYIYVPSSGAGLTSWASKLIAPMQNISNISTSKLDVILKISESAGAIFLRLQSTLRVNI